MNFIDKLNDALTTYSSATDIPLTVINDIGNECLSIGECTSFCKFFKEITDEICPCSQTHLYAGKQAEKLGEAYIFSCPAGLIHFTVPVFKTGEFKGAVLAGPILMDFPDSIMIDDIIEKFNLHLSMRGKINSSMRTILVLEPSKVRHLSKLLFTVVMSLLDDEKYELYERNQKLLQQSQISEKIQQFKHGEGPFYPFESEKDLLIKVKNGDIIGAKNILNDLIGHIFFASGGSIEVIKLRTLELCTLLSRASVDGGADYNTIFDLNNNFLGELSKIKNIEDLSYWIIKILDNFISNVFKFTDSKNAILIQKSIAYINENHKKNITLDIVANFVHLNSSYFSSLFKKETGVSFSAYLNKIRIDKAMVLLNNSMLSILEIALEVGFEDQSYFAKVFKNQTKMTPKEYRQRGCYIIQ